MVLARRAIPVGLGLATFLLLSRRFHWEPGTQVVTVCKTGARSVRAALTLNAARPATLAPVLSLRGGTLRWLAEIRGQVVNY